MRASLPVRGYEIITPSTGKGALSQLRKHVPEVVILDLVMPEMSGLEICRRVREFSSLPIIVLSAKGSESDKVAALDPGADDYVTKPFGMDELLARVRALVRSLSSSEIDTKSSELVIFASIGTNVESWWLIRRFGLRQRNSTS
jgi:two-component system KDP operon response regulator KdpE